MDVEDLVTQAVHQFTAGYAKAALAILVKALACKQDVRIYRIAAIIACAAHDKESAKLYYNKVPADLRASIEQKCQEEHVILGP